jgi:hypothetical protein
MADETSMLVPRQNMRERERDREKEMCNSKILDFIFRLNWATYIGERRTTFAKAYGIKLSCYGEHIGNLGNILGTCCEPIGNLFIVVAPKQKQTPGINHWGSTPAGGGGVLHTRRICGFEKFRTISSGYLKISIIKESPQFGWVKKLQRTVRFQTVRGGHLVFFSKHV